MDAVRNEAGRQFIAREQSLNDVVVPMKHLRRSIPEMSAQRRARGDGRIDFPIRCIRVSERNHGAQANCFRNELRAPRPLRSDCDHANPPTRSLIHSPKCPHIGRPLLSAGVRSAKSILRTQKRPLQVIAANRFRNHGILRPQRFNVRKLRAQGFLVVGN